MVRDEFHQQMEMLERKLGDTKQRQDTLGEIEILLQAAKLASAESELGMANLRFDLAARTIRRSHVCLERLPEALGERGLVLRRMKRYPEALELLKHAVAAAKEHAGPLQQARWLASQGGVHRLLGELEPARQAYEQARDLFSAQGDAGRAGVADQEGNLGLLALESGDGDEAERCYRRAVELGMAAGAANVVRTWTQNLGRALTRRRRYRDACTAFGQALAAAHRMGDEASLVSVADSWRQSYRQAHQWQQAAQILIEVAKSVAHPVVKSGLLEQSMHDLGVAGAWERVREIGMELRALLEMHGGNPEAKQRCESLVGTAQQRLEASPVPGPESGPTALDSYIPEFMARYEDAGNVDGMKDVAHLVCDLSLGLRSNALSAWKPVLTEPSLAYRVLGDAMKALCDAGRAEESLELSVRFKSLGFCLLNIERVLEKGAPHADAQAYLDSLADLSRATEQLRGPLTGDNQQRVQAVRAAGEALLDRGEALRERDPMLHANLGGLTRPHDLLDAFPAAQPVAIVDLVVTNRGTVVHLLVRDGDRVRVLPGWVPDFDTEHAEQLWRAWQEGRVAHEIGEGQRLGLIQISSILHQRIMCSLAREIAKYADQIVFVPDVFTDTLPLHLSGVCDQETAARGADAREVRFLSELFPIGYAPCLQAIAVSQHQKRPANVSSVVSLADPESNLPGTRDTAAWLGSRLPDSVRYASYVGEEATVERALHAMPDADMVVIGAHGVFDPRRPGESHLRFHDRPWTLNEMLEGVSFARHPVVVLTACEIGSSGFASELTGQGFRNGIPGALISAGAAAVVAALWQAEHISIGYLVEQFLLHLSHKGYSPAAALFRAVRDLKEMPRETALERCRRLMNRMLADGSSQRLAEQFCRLDHLVTAIEDSEEPHPFASPQYWGSVVVVGSGWHLPAGAAVTGGAEATARMLEDVVTRQELHGRIAQGRYAECRPGIEELLARADGLERARLLDMLAWVVWKTRRPGAEDSAAREAFDLLAKATLVAQAEESEQLVRNVDSTRRKIELEKEAGHVQA